jgi:molybdopterin-guanine dinucleotide biosynthesis protein A
MKIQTHNVLVLQNGSPNKLFSYDNDGDAKRKFATIACDAGMYPDELFSCLAARQYRSPEAHVILVQAENRIVVPELQEIKDLKRKLAAADAKIVAFRNMF